MSRPVFNMVVGSWQRYREEKDFQVAPAHHTAFRTDTARDSAGFQTRLYESTRRPRAKEILQTTAERAKKTMAKGFGIINMENKTAIVKNEKLRLPANFGQLFAEIIETSDAADAMKIELGFETSTPLERLLINELAASWVRLREAGRSYDRFGGGESLHHDRRLNLAQKRYLNAVVALSKVRKMVAETQAAESKMVRNAKVLSKNV